MTIIFSYVPHPESTILKQCVIEIVDETYVIKYH